MRKGKGENGPKAEAFFTLRALEAGPDVSEDELAEMGDVESLSPVFLQIPIFQNPDKWNVVRFAKNCGVDQDTLNALNLQELVETGVKGLTVKAYLKDKYIPGRDDPILEATAFAPAA